MPAKEIKELRKSGKLQEALIMAKQELDDAISKLPAVDNNPLSLFEELANKARIIWPMRNLSWVYHDYLKENNSPEHFEAFLTNLIAIKDLGLPADEKMLFDSVSWQIGKMDFGLLKQIPVDIQKFKSLFEVVQTFHFTIPSESYSFLFKAFHKAFKDTYIYLQFADWWGFQNFRPEDYEKEVMTNGKEVMALVEQAYIAYAKVLLKGKTGFSESGFELINKIYDYEKIKEFIKQLDVLIDNHPSYQYPLYFKAKLLLLSGDKENTLSALLPFAKKKRNDFWVWEILGEVFSDDSEKSFACYCKALTCNSKEEMLVSLRQKMASAFIARNLYDEAKTEIGLLVASRQSNGYKIPGEVINWQAQNWYIQATAKKSNMDFYKQHIEAAEALLFSDVSEETVIVDFVNTDKKMLNFIASETKFGYFKYDRFFKDINIGDTVSVRFQGGQKEGMYQVYTASKTNDDKFKKDFVKELQDELRIQEGMEFGFLKDAFVHPSIVKRYKLSDGLQLKASIIKSYNKDKKQWGWKVFKISSPLA